MEEDDAALAVVEVGPARRGIGPETVPCQRTVTTRRGQRRQAASWSRPRPRWRRQEPLLSRSTRTETYDQQARRRTADSLAAVPSAVAAPLGLFLQSRRSGSLPLPQAKGRLPTNAAATRCLVLAVYASVNGIDARCICGMFPGHRHCIIRAYTPRTNHPKATYTGKTRTAASSVHRHPRSPRRSGGGASNGTCKAGRARDGRVGPVRGPPVEILPRPSPTPGQAGSVAAVVGDDGPAGGRVAAPSAVSPVAPPRRSRPEAPALRSSMLSATSPATMCQTSSCSCWCSCSGAASAAMS